MRTPDHNDADLVLKLYELRRETVMRQARNFMGGFWPKNYEEAKAPMSPENPNNAYFRQATSYWEMAASFVNRHILHPDVFADNCGEGLFTYLKFEPFLAEIRANYSPTFLAQTEKAIQNHSTIRERLNAIRERQKKMANR